MSERILEEIEYKKDIHHHYMIVKDTEGIDTASYEIRMILANQIEGLLPCLIQRLDAQTYYYFEITAGQELTSVYAGKKMQYQELQILFSSLLNILKRLHSFLLDPGHLVLDPHFLYLDRGTGDYYFCYLPGYKKDMAEGFQELTEYLLPKIDHQDREAVVLGYGIHRRLMETHITLEQLEEELYKKEFPSKDLENKMERESLDSLPNADKEEILRQEALKSLFEETDWEEEGWWHRARKWWQNKRKKQRKEDKKKQEFTLPKWVDANGAEEETVCLISPSPPAQAGEKRLSCMRTDNYPDIVLNKELLFLGKAAGNVDVTIASSAISRLHARITLKKGRVLLVDMHSRNGTRLNKELLVPDQEYELHSGDMVEFADVSYQCNF